MAGCPPDQGAEFSRPLPFSSSDKTETNSDGSATGSEYSRPAMSSAYHRFHFINPFCFRSLVSFRLKNPPYHSTAESALFYKILSNLFSGQGKVLVEINIDSGTEELMSRPASYIMSEMQG